MSRPICTLVLGLIGLGLVACEQPATAEDGGTWEPVIVARYPHDSNAFTQGLIFHDGYLYESTGSPSWNGESSVRKVDLATGHVERIRPLGNEYFGEGLTLLDDKLYQITWKSQTGFVYRLEDFRPLGSFTYSGEGWGLAEDGKRLILSNGSATLQFLDPDDFHSLGSVAVMDGERPVTNLNELEYIDGEVWANIWYDDRVVRIDPDDGHVKGWIDLSGLIPASERSSDAVVNGIAYDEKNDRIFVTGKLWPAIFEISLPDRH